MVGRTTGHRWGTQPIALALAAVAVALALMAVMMTRSASADDTDAAHDHSDHAHHVSVLDHDGRFTGPGEWPPQHKGATNFGTVEITDQRGNGREIAATRSASAHQAVGRALGNRFGAASVAEMAGGQNGQHVTFFSYEQNQTVVASVIDGEVVNVEEMPASVGQPPLSPVEMDNAVAIARAWWSEQNNDRVDDLEGFAIRAFQPDGSFFPVRMAYVSFHVDVDAAPELLTYVDLTNEIVTEGLLDQ